jgi:NADH-quinone oxidoreductase subunit N
MIILDGYSQFFEILIAAALAATVLLSARGLDVEHVPRAEYHVLLLLAATAMMLAVSAHDLLPLFLGLELVTLCSYILVGIRVERPASNEAAIKYFLLGSFASALLIYGISLTYGVTKTTHFAVIASALSSHNARGNLLLMAGVLVIAGWLSRLRPCPCMHGRAGCLSRRHRTGCGWFQSGRTGSIGQGLPWRVRVRGTLFAGSSGGTRRAFDCHG